MLIELNDREQMRAIAIGADRFLATWRISAPRSNLRDYRETLGRAVVGVMGEFAAAKALRLPTPVWPVGTEVRTGMHARSMLVVRPDTLDSTVLVWVRGHEAPLFTVIGWLSAFEAKRPEFWKSPAGKPAAYFVPDFKMRPLATMPTPTNPEEASW